MVKAVYHLTWDFAAMVLGRPGEHLNTRLEAVEASRIVGLWRFVRALQRGRARPVQAGLSEPWRNVQTEGQIQRLKLLKRQTYGERAVRCRGSRRCW